MHFILRFDTYFIYENVWNMYTKFVYEFMKVHIWPYAQKHACGWLKNSPNGQKWSDHPLG